LLLSSLLQDVPFSDVQALARLNVIRYERDPQQTNSSSELVVTFRSKLQTLPHFTSSFQCIRPIVFKTTGQQSYLREACIGLFLLFVLRFRSSVSYTFTRDDPVRFYDFIPDICEYVLQPRYTEWQHTPGLNLFQLWLQRSTSNFIEKINVGLLYQKQGIFCFTCRPLTAALISEFNGQ